MGTTVIALPDASFHLPLGKGGYCDCDLYGSDNNHFAVFPETAIHHYCLDGLRPGCYFVHGRTQEVAYSHTWFDRFRELMSIIFLEAANEDVWSEPKKFVGRPFIDFVSIALCDGTIGSLTAAKIANEFTEHASRFEQSHRSMEQQGHPPEWMEERHVSEYIKTYQDMVRLFHHAAKGGVILFRI